VDDLRGPTRAESPGFTADTGGYNGGYSDDLDGDAMPDWWETKYGLVSGVNDSGGNADGDALTNLEEYNAGTNPGEFDFLMIDVGEGNLFLLNTGGEWENSFDEPGVLQFRGRCHPIEARMELELALTNDTKQVWHDVHANVCVSLATAPQFADPGLERTFYAAAEGLKPVVREGLYEWAHGFIAVASEDGAATIAYGWPVQEKPDRPHVGDPALACVHANPHYGTLEPGQPVVQRGVIYTLLGTPADAYQQFRMEQLQATSGGDTKNRKN